MENVVDLLEYKKKKEENEIEALRKELADLIEDMGGIHVVPFMMQPTHGLDHSFLPPSMPSITYYDQAGCSFDYSYYLQEQGEDGNKE